MKVYHGSFMEVPAPDVLHSRKNVDFGKGFYVTPIFEQAKKWALRFRREGKASVVSSYEFDERSYEEFKVLSFKEYSEEWLDFILDCRKGNDRFDYDVVIGGVANDRVFNTIELFSDGLIDKEETIKRLRYERPNLQICFRTQEAINRTLTFVGSETV